MSVQAYSEQTIFRNANFPIDDDFNAPTYGQHVELGNGYVFVAFNDVTNSLGKCKIGTRVSEFCIEWGSEYTFNSGSCAYIIPVVLSTTKVLIVYQDISNSSYGTSICASISGSTITFGTKVVFNSGTTTPIGASYLDTDKVIIAFANNTTNGQTVIATTSSLVVSYGTIFTFKATTNISAYTMLQQICAVSSTKAVIAYRVSATISNAQCLNISGTTITGATEYAFGGSYDNRYISIINLTATKIAITYTGSQQVSNGGYYTIGNISTNAISYETPSYVDAAGYTDPNFYRRMSLLRLADNMFAAFSYDFSSNYSGSLTVFKWNSTDSVTKYTGSMCFKSGIYYLNPQVTVSVNTSISYYNGNLYYMYKDTNGNAWVLGGAKIKGNYPYFRDMCFKIAEAGVGEQIEISGVNIKAYVSTGSFVKLFHNNTNVPFFNHRKESTYEDPFSDYVGNVQLNKAGCPIILKTGEALYVSSTYYYSGEEAVAYLVGLERT